MKHTALVSRRRAIQMVSRTALGASLAAGAAGVLGRPSSAQAACVWTLAVGHCKNLQGKNCASGYWCYHNNNTGQYNCCQSSGQQCLGDLCFEE